MDVTLSELKAHLRRYLREASRGARITVWDQDEAIAEIGPAASSATSWHDRLHEQGRLTPGSQEWETLQITPIDTPIDVQASLRAVREDPNDVRGR